MDVVFDTGNSDTYYEARDRIFVQDRKGGREFFNRAGDKLMEIHVGEPGWCSLWSTDAPDPRSAAALSNARSRKPVRQLGACTGQGPEERLPGHLRGPGGLHADALDAGTWPWLARSPGHLAVFVSVSSTGG